MLYHIKLQDSKNYYFDGYSFDLYKDYYPNIQNESTIKNDKKTIPKSELKRVTIILTNKCNANCVYCYENKNDFSLNKKNALKIISELKKYKNIEQIDFFGGEPLLNYNILVFIVNELNKYVKINAYSITTNLMLLTEEMLNFFEKYNFKIICSFDGPEEIHNMLRKGCPHASILERIEMIKKYEKLNKNFEINCTYTKLHREKYSKENLKNYFESLNIKKYNITNVISNNEELKLPEKDVFSIIDKKINSLLEYKEKCTNIYIKNVLNAILYKDSHSYLCKDMVTGCAYDTNGKRFPCTRLAFETQDINNNIVYYNMKKGETCINCWAKNLCTICPVSELSKNSLFFKQKNTCKYKKIYEYIITKICQLYDDDPKLFQKMFDNYMAMEDL